MADSEQSSKTGRFEVKADVPTHFGWLRMSIERTLMSWVRTATALIGFGFTIFQFLQRFNQTPGIKPAVDPWTLVGFRFGAHRNRHRCADYCRLGIPVLVPYLWEKDFKPIAGVDEFAHHTPVVAVSVVLILIGIFAFAAVLLREP